MDRRQFIQCAALAISGVSASQLGFTLNPQQEQFLSTMPNYNKGEADYFTTGQRKIIAAMAETILPRTDTPGAIDAGVPNFVELMVSDWFNDEERAIFDAGLKDIETRIPREHGSPFNELSQQVQLDIMESLENEASDSSWYGFGELFGEYQSDAPFVCHLKELVIWGFFTSEVGATQVLRFDGMPMQFDGELPIDPDESTWASYL